MICPASTRRFSCRSRRPKGILPCLPDKGNSLKFPRRPDREPEHEGCELQPLEVGADVFIQDQMSHKWEKTGHVAKKLSERTYQVQIRGGRLLTRNRKFLRLRVRDPSSSPERSTCTTILRIRRTRHGVQVARRARRGLKMCTRQDAFNMVDKVQIYPIDRNLGNSRKLA
eukprot:snap_masked-scaffold163_size295297-processed-gene-0.3 protein:Tk10073 transcript:snap_masked-scaffold163_size295297-processed-gene-0.3-mRNA-1 annotation:"hypothetical protein DAPPUDRAFT_116586"